MMKTNDFIKKANKIHNNKYDYSLVDYKNNITKIEIICPIHNKFEQIPNSHLSGRGCSFCGTIERVKKQSLTKKRFIEKANIIHNNKYNYSLVEYKNNKIKVEIKCEKHGMFKIKPNCHLTGGGCPRCVGRGKTTEDFILEANIKHGNKFDYSLIKYSGTFNKVKIICKIHGEFEITANRHLNGGGCPYCSSSIGENKIRDYLIENNIEFISQHRFKDCRDKNPLPFDFYLPNYNTCIEYQGEQHFKPVNYFGGLKNFETQKKRDLIKNNYCIANKINLLIINYNDNVKEKLENNVC